MEYLIIDEIINEQSGNLEVFCHNFYDLSLEDQILIKEGIYKKQLIAVWGEMLDTEEI